MKKIYFLIILIITLCSCKKEVSQNVVSPNVDVYVAGFVADSSRPDEVYPTYWKNGIPTQLNFDYAIQEGWANSIFVSGNDVYVGGYRINFSFSSITTADMFWKNGVANDPLTVGGGVELTSLIVSDNNIYTVQKGNLGSGSIASYWKNDKPVFLTDGSQGSTAEAIIVSGNDVYLAGTGMIGPDNNPIGFAKYWKNGVPVNLTDGSINANTSSITVSGNDVYVGGTQYDGATVNGRRNGIAKYWKNGKMVNLTDGSADAAVSSIAVSGSDVYVAGTEYDGASINGYRKGIAKYWKNGKAVNLTDGSADAIASSIAVGGNDVYVAGIQNVTYYGGLVGTATYWKNGVAVKLTDASKQAGANSIFLANQ